MSGVPKAELHVHLEGTATPALVRRLAARNHVALPEDLFSDDDTFNWLDFSHFLTVYDTASSVIVTPEDYRDVTYDYLVRSAAEGVVYCEMFSLARPRRRQRHDVRRTHRRHRSGHRRRPPRPRHRGLHRAHLRTPFRARTCGRGGASGGRRAASAGRRLRHGRRRGEPHAGRLRAGLPPRRRCRPADDRACRRVRRP